MDPRKKAETAQRETDPLPGRMGSPWTGIDGCNGMAVADWIERLNQAKACHRKITQARGGKGAGTRPAKGAAYAAATIVKTKSLF